MSFANVAWFCAWRAGRDDLRLVRSCLFRGAEPVVCLWDSGRWIPCLFSYIVRSLVHLLGQLLVSEGAPLAASGNYLAL
jgi:hypothetical protein